MPSLKQLQKENQRLRQMQSRLSDMKKNNEDRKKLLKENQRLTRDIKHGRAMGVGRATGKVLSNVGKASGKGLLKAGKGAFRGLQRYANFLEQQERKQKMLNRQLRSTGIKSAKKKSTRRRK